MSCFNVSIDPSVDEPDPSNFEEVAGYAHMAAERLNGEDLCLFCGNHGAGLFVPDPKLPRAVGIDACGICGHYAEFFSARHLLRNLEIRAKVLA